MTSPMIKELLDKPTACTSMTRGRPSRTIYFRSLATDRLRELAPGFAGPGPYYNYDRAMLLALFHNRNPSGYYIEVQEDPI